MPLQNNLLSGLCYDFSLCLRAYALYVCIHTYVGWGAEVFDGKKGCCVPEMKT